MNKFLTLGILSSLVLTGCGEVENKTALEEQKQTEINQRVLLENQPPPKISWSLERDNLTKRFKLQNDRSVVFFMYLFIEGIGEPIGYYQVNKVSSVNSQLTNPEQIVDTASSTSRFVLPSPAEDGSYGSNGDAVFGFTPEQIYLETNLKYVVSTIPLNFVKPVNKLAIIDSDEAEKLLEKTKKSMG